MKKIKLKDIEPYIGNYKLVGPEPVFHKASTIEDADSNSIIWISPNKKDYKNIVNSTVARVILVSNVLENELLEIDKKSIILVQNPRLTFLRICKEFFTKKIEYSIHSSSIIHPNANISQNVFIGPNCYIGECIINSGAVIAGNTFINDRVNIGVNVSIGANCSIGLDGFGYQLNELNIWEKFPHLGGVIIEEGVDIGSNTCIDRGTLGNTIIRKNTKIDNLVHISHNVEIGENSMIIANAMIGGSTLIENNVWVSPSSSIRDGLTIEKNSLIGLGAVITKSVPSNEIWIGNPGRKLSK